jgi:hypothetical protein
MNLIPNSASLREVNPCHNPSGPKGGQFCSKGGGDFETFLQQAVGGLKATSRTAAGMSDTSSSAEKPKLAVEGEALKVKAEANYKRALRMVWDARHGDFSNPAKVSALIEHLGHVVNAGLLPPGQSIWRQHTTNPAFGQTAPADIPRELETFSAELSHRITAGADPIGTAAWIEHEFNGRIHPFTDGMGRASKALAAMVLARAGLSLPQYPDRKIVYGAIGGPADAWERLYRSWFKT